MLKKDDKKFEGSGFKVHFEEQLNPDDFGDKKLTEDDIKKKQEEEEAKKRHENELLIKNKKGGKN